MRIALRAETKVSHSLLYLKQRFNQDPRRLLENPKFKLPQFTQSGLSFHNNELQAQIPLSLVHIKEKMNVSELYSRYHFCCSVWLCFSSVLFIGFNKSASLMALFYTYGFGNVVHNISVNKRGGHKDSHGEVVIINYCLLIHVAWAKTKKRKNNQLCDKLHQHKDVSFKR